MSKTVSKPISYPIPWDIVFGLTKHFANGTRESVDAFSRGVTERIQPPAVIEGLEHLPADPRFILVPNHYERKGLWILHCASVITQVIRQRYGPGDPPVRWVVTANWPPIKLGKWTLASPGDILLPKVAHVLHCYPVSFAGTNAQFTAQSIRRILKEAPESDRPLGLFPEGAAGIAGQLTDPLPGVERLIAHLGKRGMPAVPCGISENGRFIIRFGQPIAPKELVSAPDAARLCMQRIAGLI